MDYLDRSTLSLLAAVMWGLGWLMMLGIRQVDRTLPGPGWWLAGATLFGAGFLLSGPNFEALGWPGSYGYAINHATSLAGVLCLLEGALAFRRLRPLPLAVLLGLPPVFLLVTLLLRDAPAYRYAFVDACAVLMVCATAAVFLWRVPAHERSTHAIAALFLLVAAAVFGGRFWLAVSLPQADMLLGHGYQNLATLGVLVFTVGWSYSASLACYLRAHRTLQAMARVDGLTGLANRRHFDEALQQELSRSRRGGGRFAVCMIDLDRFKQVNDQHGHEAGDALLIEVAERLRRTVRAGDLAARLGGDEFVVLVRDFGEDPPYAATRGRLRSGLDGPIQVSGRALCIAASLGLASWPRDATDLMGLLSRADQDMYADKQARRGLQERAAGR